MDVNNNRYDSLKNPMSHDLPCHKLCVEGVPIGVPDEAPAVLQP